MGKASGTNIIYSEPFVTKVGGLLFSVTRLEIGAEEEYPKGGIELEPTKLGLTDGLISGPGQGGVSTTYGAIWCTPLLEVKFTEFKKGGGKAYPAQINCFLGEKPVLTLLQAGKEKEFALELTEAEGKSLKGYTTTVFAFGR